MILYCSEECTSLKELLEEKTRAVDLVTSENQELKAQLEETRVRADAALAENKMLIDRWMLQKMQDAEKLNEVILLLGYYYVIYLMSLIVVIVCCNAPWLDFSIYLTFP